MAWIFFNLFSVGLTTALIYYTLRQLDVSFKVSGFAATLFLIMPIIFWHATQPLVEITICLLAAAFIAASLSSWNNHIKFLVLNALAMIGYQIVSIFQPVLLAILGGFIWNEWRRGKRRSIPITIFYVSITGICLYLNSFNDTTLGFSVMQLVMNGALGGTAMDLWLHEGPLPFSLSAFAGKILSNFSYFITINSSQLFFLPFIILLFIIAFGFFTKWREKSDGSVLLIGYIVIVSLSVYGAVITLHQNQARYIVYILPILIVAATWLHHGLIERLISHRYGILASGATLVAFIFASTVLAVTLRSDSVASAVQSASFRRIITTNSSLKDAKILIECYQGSDSLQLTYAVPDKIFIHISPERVATPLKRIAELSRARLVLCPADTTKTIRKNIPDLSLRRIGTVQVGPINYEISHIDLGD